MRGQGRVQVGRSLGPTSRIDASFTQRKDTARLATMPWLPRDHASGLFRSLSVSNPTMTGLGPEGRSRQAEAPARGCPSRQAPGKLSRKLTKDGQKIALLLVNGNDLLMGTIKIQANYKNKQKVRRSLFFLGSRIVDCQSHGDLRNVLSAS